MSNARRNVLWASYDVLWLALATPVYGLSLFPAGVVLQLAHSRWGWLGLLFAALPAYFLFVLSLVLLLAAIRLVSPRIQPGVHKKHSGVNFFALIWRAGLLSLVQNTPLIRTINFLAVLRYLHYRGQGMQTHFSNWLGAEAVISDPSLVTLGKGVSLGDFAVLSAHLALPDAIMILPIAIGDGTMVGGAAKIGPGVEIGPNALIGAEAALAPRVKVGEGAYVEPFSRVAADTVIEPYERWGGHPAVKIGTRARPED